jgi:hypothetical protein
MLSQVEIDDHGSVVADSFELTDGRILVMRNNYDDVAAVQVNNLLIGKGCTLQAKAYHNLFQGSVQLEGALLVEPSGGSGYANMTIYGIFFSFFSFFISFFSFSFGYEYFKREA